MSDQMNRRILVIDDQQSIRDDFRKILGGTSGDDAAPTGARSAFLGKAAREESKVDFGISTASQGLEGIERLEQAVADGVPFAMAFVDVRMPPGIDGLQAIERLWRVDPDLQVVICTAYSDY